MFERDGKSLGECIVELTSEDEALRLAAATRIMLMEFGLPNEKSSFCDINADECGAFASAVKEIVSAPQFPAERLIPRLLELYKAAERVDCCKALARAAHGRTDPNRSVANVAAQILINAGPRSICILPELIRMIEGDPEEEDARLAAAVVASIGPVANEATDALLLGLRAVGADYEMQSEEETIWNPFVRALAAFAREDASLRGRIVEMARGGEDEEQEGAIATLHALGPLAIDAVPLLVELLDHEDVGYLAFDAVRAIDPDDTCGVKGEMFRRLSTCDEFLRSSLAKRLRELGYSDRELADELSKAPIERASELDEDVDDGDMDEAGDTDPEARVDFSLHLSQLLRGLLAEDRATRQVAGNTLLELSFGSPSRSERTEELNEKRFKDDLAALFQDPEFPTADVLGGIIRRYAEISRDYQKRVARAKSMGWMTKHEALTIGMSMTNVIENCGPGGVQVLRDLAMILRSDSEDCELSHVAANAMKSIGSAACAILDDLLESVITNGIRRWPNPCLEFIAVHGLEPDQLARVMHAADNSPDHLREAAIEVLRVLGPRAVAARDILMRAARAESVSIRTYAIDAIANVLGGDSEVLSLLIERTRDQDSECRSYAATALGKLGEATDEVVARLFELTGDEDWMVRGEAIRSLGKLGRSVDRVVTTAIRFLDDSEGHDWSVADRAMEALGALGARAAPAVPMLIQLLESECEVRLSVVEALGAIGPAATEALDRLRVLRMCWSDRRAEIDRAIALIEGAGHADSQ